MLSNTRGETLATMMLWNFRSHEYSSRTSIMGVLHYRENQEIHISKIHVICIHY